MLQNVDGMQFFLPPNNITEERMDIGLSKKIPLFNYRFWFRNYKLGFFISKFGFKKAVKNLRIIIEKDTKNIDYFIKKWHLFHKPLLVDLEGNVIEKG